MAGNPTSAGFLLAAACCRWPKSDRKTAAIRSIAEGEMDWLCFQRLVERHRIDGLVHDALTTVTGLKIPPQIQSALTEGARRVARRSLSLTAETIRLQRAFDDASIPALVLKGAALAQLAYGSAASKRGRDVDFVVPPDFALRAFQLLESLGYQFSLPVNELNTAQRVGLVRYGNEAEFVHRSSPLRVDLHWQLAYNPALLKDIGARAPAQAVDISGFGVVRTLGDADLFAYLCVHGAYHRWSRLKWLADLNALISAKDGPGIVALYRHAQKKGAGFCAAQALLLSYRLLDLKLPIGLLDELNADRRAKRLVEIALRAMTAVESADLSLPGHFLLGEGLPYFASQLRIVCTGLPDVIRFPLPSSLHFLYPVLRLPLLIWRRANRSAFDKRNDRARSQPSKVSGRATSANHDARASRAS